MTLTATTCFTTAPSPIGDLLMTAEDGALTRLWTRPHDGVLTTAEGWERTDTPFESVLRELDDYWNGRLRKFSVSLAPKGTDFQQRVWRELTKIPYGTTISYGELARRIGRPGAARPAGGACGRNPIAVIVPCHRVIGAHGSLTGYGGGLDRKQQLLTLEGAGQS